MKNSKKVVKLISILLLMLWVIVANFYACTSEKTTEPTKQGPMLIVSPQPQLYFGQIPAGQGNNAYREFKISNGGEQKLVVSRLVTEGADAELFTVQDPGQIELGSIESTIIGVDFHPQTNGNFSAQVKIESNANSSPDTYDLTGKGTSITGNSITFERIIGSINNDGAACVRITTDGEYIIAGTTAHPSGDGTIATLTFLDVNGNQLWQELYPGNERSSFTSLVITEDGGYVAVGQTGGNVYVVKTDANGKNPIELTYGGSAADYASAIEKTTDGGYIVAGRTNNTNPGGGLQDALLLKLDANLSAEWMGKYGNEEGEDARAVKQTSDGGYIFAGSQPKGASQDVYLVKTMSNGSLEWQKNFGGSDVDAANDIIITDEGDYVLAGFTIDQANDMYVIKTDASGNQLWSKTYGGSGNNEATAIIQTKDSGFLIVGSTPSLENGSDDVYIIKTDGAGDLNWEQRYGGEGDDGASCVREDTPSGYIISGTAGMGSFSRSTEKYMLKINNTGQIGP